MILYKKGYKYQLYKTFRCWVDIKADEDIETYFISLTTEGLLTIRRGYAWDGPSGPTKFIMMLLELIPLIGEWLAQKFIEKFLTGSLIHDALYQLLRERKLSKECRVLADKELVKYCKKAGMSWPRRLWVYQGVRRGAGFAANSKNVKKVYMAP